MAKMTPWQAHSHQCSSVLDVVKQDMAEVEVKEEDADDRSNWRLKIRCGDP